MSEIEVSKAKPTDSQLLFNWRNDPEIYKYFGNPNPITIEEHEDWFSKALDDPDVFIYLFSTQGAIFGQVRFNLNFEVAEVSISLDSNYHGKGLGSKLLLLGEKELLKERRCEKIIATVNPENKSSERIFVKSGFSKSDNLTFEKLVQQDATPLFRQHYNLEKQWDEINTKFLSDSIILRWSFTNKVFLKNEKILKVQSPNAPEEQILHSPQHEYNIYKILENYCWKVSPSLIEENGWQIFEKDFVGDVCLDDLLIKNQKIPFRGISKIITTLFKVARKGILYHQFRSRHIFFSNNFKDVYFIDFGGSPLKTPIESIIFNLLSFKTSKIYGVLKLIARNNLKLILKKNKTKLQKTKKDIIEYKKNFKPHYLKSRFLSGANISEEDLNELREYEVKILDKVIKTKRVVDINTFVLGNYNYFLWGTDDWPLVWDQIRRTVPANERVKVIDNGSALGICSISALLSGSTDVTYVTDGEDVLNDWMMKIVQLIGKEKYLKVITKDELEPNSKFDLSFDVSLYLNDESSQAPNYQSNYSVLKSSKKSDQASLFQISESQHYYRLKKNS